MHSASDLIFHAYREKVVAMRNPNAVTVIGASGQVGQAAVNVLANDLGYDVYTVNRRGGDPEKRLRDAERYSSAVVSLYLQNGLDARHASWLLKDFDYATEKRAGQVTAVEATPRDTEVQALWQAGQDARHALWEGDELLPKQQQPEALGGAGTAADRTAKLQADLAAVLDIKQALEVSDLLVVASGMPRKPGQDRNDPAILTNNARIFRTLGQQIGRAYVMHVQESLAAEPPRQPLPLPSMVNAGNPMDEMTYLLARSLDVYLEMAMNDAANPNRNRAFIDALQDARNSIPQRVMGQGGILDEVRAAFAVADALGIAPADVVRAPVQGPHNNQMELDWKRMTVRLTGGREITGIQAIAEAWGVEDVAGLQQTIAQSTRSGGMAVQLDTKAKTGVEQSAFMGTGAALAVQSFLLKGGQAPNVSAYARAGEVRAVSLPNHLENGYYGQPADLNPEGAHYRADAWLAKVTQFEAASVSAAQSLYAAMLQHRA